MTLTPASPALVEDLASRLPAGRVSVPDPAHLSEPRGRAEGASAVLVRPADTAEVAEVVRFASRHRVGIVPYAGGTGLVGGQVAGGVPTILLSVERLCGIEVLADDALVVAGAGAILSDVQAAAAQAGYLFPLSLASEGSARIGGLLSTNAGGVGVLRYGNARDLCLGVEAVLPDGSVFNGLKRLRKDNTGYDLRNLLIGAEGTLGIITAANLRLYPRPAETATALAALASPTDALRVLGHMRDRLADGLSAFELVHRQGIDFLAEVLPDTPQPFDEVPEWLVLLEAGSAAGAGVAQRTEAVLADALESGLVSDVLVAQNQAQTAAFWSIRERIPEANRLIGAIASHDISLPISAVPDFIAQCAPRLHSLDAGLRINCFGHLGDGNLHYNAFPAPGLSRADYEHLRGKITRAVHDLVHEMGGSISAEHGIGRFKVADLERYGDPAKLAAMRTIKQALDPVGIMNPGAVLRGP